MEEVWEGGFTFSVYQVCDQSGDRYTGNSKYFVPIDFLWTDWQQRCEDELARKTAEQERKRAEQKAKQEEYRAKQEAERYEKAKQIIKDYENHDSNT